MEQQSPSSVDIGVSAGLRELFGKLSRERRREFVMLVALMLVGAVAELATIGSVIPFLALLSQQAGPVQLPWLPTLFASLGPRLGIDPILAAAIVFGTFAVVAGLIRLELAWLTQDFVFRAGHELAYETQRRILSQPYSFYIERNSSTLISATYKVEVLVFDLALPMIQAVTAAFISAFLLAALLFVNPIATAIAAATFLAIYGLLSAVVAKRLIANSHVEGAALPQRLKIEQESLGGIRDVIIDSSQATHLELFGEVNARLARARASTNFMSQAPRFIVESVGIVIVVGIALLLSHRTGGIALAIPFLGALAVGAQRLLPLVQTVYTGWSLAAAHRSIVGEVIELLRLPLPDSDEAERLVPPPLRDCIRFDQVSFHYPRRPDRAAIDNVTFEIPCGSMVAFIGETGSGKTTLADLLMGLIEPTDGRISIDAVLLDRANSRAWQRSIAHVPQSIFLADTTIARNVALSRGSQPLDLARVTQALEMASLQEFVESLPSGYDTVVGERGVRLSGGQRQRLGIARAIYKDTPILVFDEATSALDELTENAVIATLEELRRQGRTIIIVAHRLSTIRRCDLVARLERGKLVEFGDFAEVVDAQAKLS
jgi:ATP-binding cassette subfamily B protein